jgi:hypothetical protein
MSGFFQAQISAAKNLRESAFLFYGKAPLITRGEFKMRVTGTIRLELHALDLGIIPQGARFVALKEADVVM